MPAKIIHPFYVLKHLGIHLEITPVEKGLMKIEMDLTDCELTDDETIKVIKILYRDYLVSDIPVSEYDGAPAIHYKA